VFIDESGFLMAPLVRRTWARRGHTPLLRQRGRHHSKVSAIAALVVPPSRDRLRCYFRLHVQANINGRLTAAFVRQLLLQLQTALLIVWDRLNTHRAPEVQRLLRQHQEVRCEFFPPYAPELNPVEYLWGYDKTNALANYPTFSPEELARTVHRCTRTVQRDQTLLRAFLRHTGLSLRLT
jgi:transposase